MFLTLFLLFTVIPFIELYLLVLIGGKIGFLHTLGFIVLTAMIGAALARSQGFRVIGEIQSAMNQGKIPARELLHGALVLAGGLLLLTPGFLTDFVGFSLLVPLLRRFYVQRIYDYFSRRMKPPSIRVDYHEL